MRKRVRNPAVAAALAAAALAAALTGCGGSGRAPARHGTPADARIRQLALESRPIGQAPAFHPPARGPVVGPCSRTPGPRTGVHVELFAANRVVLVAAGIGTRPPRRLSQGRIVSASCFGDVITVEPTGVVLLRPGRALRLSDLFRSWGQPLSGERLAGFSAGPGRRVEVFVDGHRWHGSPAGVPMRRHSEIVLEVGPHVPPHSSYPFPPGS